MFIITGAIQLKMYSKNYFFLFILKELQGADFLTILPVDSVVEINTHRVEIHSDNQDQVQSHAEIGRRQVHH